MVTETSFEGRVITCPGFDYSDVIFKVIGPGVVPIAPTCIEREGIREAMSRSLIDSRTASTW